MKSASKAIRLSQHTREQLIFRGTTEGEIVETIRTSKWQAAELDRLECRKDFIFNQSWNNTHYKTKSDWPVYSCE